MRIYLWVRKSELEAMERGHRLGEVRRPIAITTFNHIPLGEKPEDFKSVQVEWDRYQVVVDHSHDWKKLEWHGEVTGYSCTVCHEFAEKI